MTSDLPEFSCIFKAKIKAVEIANLVSKKNPNAVAEDLASFFLSDITNLIIKEILK